MKIAEGLHDLVWMLPKPVRHCVIWCIHVFAIVVMIAIRTFEKACEFFGQSWHDAKNEYVEWRQRWREYFDR